MLENFFAVLAFGAAVIAAIGRTWDVNKGGRWKFTWLGSIALVIALIACILSIVITSKKNREQQELDKNQKEQISYLKGVAEGQKEQLGITQGIEKKQEAQLATSQKLTNAQDEQLATSQRLTKVQDEQLALSRDLVKSQGTQMRLSKSLTEEQREQIKQIEQLRLDRDLSGVEISFKPTAAHWAKIARACDKIKPAYKGFPYSASTIKAERAIGYWNIDFGEIEHPEGKGSIRPPRLSTNLPENKAVEEVIDTALVELSIIWSDDDDIMSVVSNRGDYPTSVIISKDMIAFIFRPNDLRLSLGYLKGNPTVTFRGQQEPVPASVSAPAPTSITIRSLDYKAKFDESIELNWKYKRGNVHLEKWMPYISGPHPLNIDWSNPHK